MAQAASICGALPGCPTEAEFPMNGAAHPAQSAYIGSSAAQSYRAVKEGAYLTASLASHDLSGYQGPDRRQQSRRAPIPQDEREWRMLNLALIGGEQRASFGRRASDYALHTGAMHI
ncbi:hypothetical protein [Chitinimonas sp.]|uniref:hypothetical protein n=1 Tax=Chitinimonas sp. TaxID=1934313 RepID=UPI0035B09991